MGSIAHHWLQEGIEKGIEKGMQLQKAKDEEIMGNIAHHWLQEGIEKGMQLQKAKDMEVAEYIVKAEKITLVKKMLTDKEPIEKILKYTGLTKKEIEQLK